MLVKEIMIRSYERFDYALVYENAFGKHAVKKLCGLLGSQCGSARRLIHNPSRLDTNIVPTITLQYNSKCGISMRRRRREEQ